MLADRVRMSMRREEIELPEGYVWATDEDFEFISSTLSDYYKDGVRGYFNYIGEGEYIAIPNTIQGVPMNSYYRLFRGYIGSQLKGVASYNENVTNMTSMFQNCGSLTSLDLSSFDTSNVTNMSSMFDGSGATTLDLSSFDTSNVTNMANMFYNSSATTGYARTQADADRFNNSSNKPSTLVFVVK